MLLLLVYLASSEKTHLSFPVKTMDIPISVEENLMKDKNTGVQHVTGILCTPGGTLV